MFAMECRMTKKQRKMEREKFATVENPKHHSMHNFIWSIEDYFFPVDVAKYSFHFHNENNLWWEKHQNESYLKDNRTVQNALFIIGKLYYSI